MDLDDEGYLRVYITNGNALQCRKAMDTKHHLP